MKRLTEQEINFIKETGWTPTLAQMSYSKLELERTAFKGLEPEVAKAKFYEEAEKYGLDLDALFSKTCSQDNYDGISLEYEATYLLYTFLPKEKLEKIEAIPALQWLQDFKYYFGYRKWGPEDAIIAVNEALEIHAGTMVFYEETDGDVWNKEVER